MRSVKEIWELLLLLPIVPAKIEIKSVGRTKKGLLKNRYNANTPTTPETTMIDNL